MNATDFIARLDGAKRVGKKWVARCPAHEDRQPSLSVTESDDGRILVHCFAGCSALDILAAVGLELHDLFPDRPRTDDLTPRQRRDRQDTISLPRWRRAVPVVREVAGQMQRWAAMMSQGPLPDAEYATFVYAVERLDQAIASLQSQR